MKRVSKLTATRLSAGTLIVLGMAVALNAANRVPRSFANALIPAFRAIDPGPTAHQQSNVSQESSDLRRESETTPELNSQPSMTQKTRSPAPWSKPPRERSEVPQVFLDEWRQVGNRGSACAAIAPTSLGSGQGATPRPANFGTDAWAIAYDKPGLPGRSRDGSFCENCGRGAFGIAGTSVNINGSRYQGWPFHREWADGSRADYGPEGGDSLPYLAYLEISGQRCLYNVWSFLGRDHLEHLLDHLRFINGAP